MQFIIRLFPEITIKSHSVRKRWSKRLADNIRLLARRIYEPSSVTLDWDRILVRVRTDDETVEAAIIDMLSHTPGIAHFSKVSAYEFTDMHNIYERVLDYWQGRLQGKTFCVRAKRSGKHAFNSLDLERYIGGGIHQHCQTAGVSLKHPDVLIQVELNDQQCYVVEQRYPGLGGFPVGTQESVLSLVSGGFDSTVASYHLMRRGIKTHFCFFNLGGREHELGVKEIAFYLWNKYGSSHRVKFISVPFEPVVHEIMTCIEPSNMGVVLKRMMLRAAEQIAHRGRSSALVTGEAISQVSSQTLPNLQLIDSVTDTLVLRPLITMDKPAIIDEARRIGTAELSAAIPEYCGVIAVRPSASVNQANMLEEEARFDLAVLDQAVADAKVQDIDAIMTVADSVEEQTPITIIEQEYDGLCVIDIRHPNEAERRPLVLERAALRSIPFYALNAAIQELDAQQAYALYCDKGVMSQLHAAHLQSNGLKHIHVYRPER